MRVVKHHVRGAGGSAGPDGVVLHQEKAENSKKQESDRRTVVRRPFAFPH